MIECKTIFENCSHFNKTTTVEHKSSHLRPLKIHNIFPRYTLKCTSKATINAAEYHFDMNTFVLSFRNENFTYENVKVHPNIANMWKSLISHSHMKYCGMSRFGDVNSPRIKFNGFILWCSLRFFYWKRTKMVVFGCIYYIYSFCFSDVLHKTRRFVWVRSLFVLSFDRRASNNWDYIFRIDLWVFVVYAFVFDIKSGDNWCENDSLGSKRYTKNSI